jgi:hypothetical protein
MTKKGSCYSDILKAAICFLVHYTGNDMSEIKAVQLPGYTVPREFILEITQGNTAQV